MEDEPSLRISQPLPQMQNSFKENFDSNQNEMHRLTLVNQHTFNEQQDLMHASYTSAPADFSRAVDNENDISLV